MGISKEEKDFIINEINKLTTGKPLFYLKFCSTEQFAQDICDGNLYGNTAEYFRQQEIKSGERGQGDRFETILSIQTNNITAIDRETGNIAFNAPKGTFTVQFESDKKIPIISFVGIPFQEMKIIEADETHTSFLLPFTDEEYINMSSKFGKYCVVLSGKELENRISAYCNAYGYDYLFDKIEYCNQNRLDRIEAFNKCAKERFLYKNADLAYQREYRLAIGIEIPDDHFIRLGPFSSAKYIESEKLKDLYYVINYKSKTNG
ncbi:MAG: hypothetical protein ACOX85_03010 [Candidatus Pararuminococcus gallinarum]|jgi:hypothetical protein